MIILRGLSLILLKGIPSWTRQVIIKDLGDYGIALRFKCSTVKRWRSFRYCHKIKQNSLSRWSLLVSSLLLSLQLLVDSEDAGGSLVVLTDQETSKVLLIELLKPFTHTQHKAATVKTHWNSLQYKFLHLLFAAIYWLFVGSTFIKLSTRQIKSLETNLSFQ